MMTGTYILTDISDCAWKAAKVYPQLIRIMDAEGISLQERQRVLSYLAQVIHADEPATLLQ